jgi:4-hydroxybenzoate polyprenyltransferase
MSLSVRSIDQPAPTQTSSEGLPLCVNLEGMLVLSDLSFESLILLIKRNPFYLVCILVWLLGGRARLKAEIAGRVTLNPAALPYSLELLHSIKSERERGRRLWLCATSHESLARTVAAHFGLFEGVIASDRWVNLRVENMPARLVEQFGARGFDYCGDARDSAVRRQARSGRALLCALRPHQWAKNGLVLLPLLAAHRANDLRAVAEGALALIAFCLCASSVYILNDLLDLEADRANPRKATRPFAAGDLPLWTGCLLTPGLLGLAFAVAMFLPSSLFAALGGYYAFTLAYSFVLKGVVLVDALALAGLYTLRIVAGAAAVDVPLSFWMLLFSLFLFLSLAFVNRYAELDALRRRNQRRTIGRDYEVQDLPVLQSLGTSAGYLSVLVLGLYINSPEIEALYHRPKVIWALCTLLLFWVSRVWMVAQRGAMHDDPVVFALKDRVSLAIFGFALITVLLAL